ncbi:MAG TPA: hypothetical protein VGV35_11320 [Bryobacteraceae bacterium]|nr:hypothetical protein [Bryobacteraceae bacterium]
MRCVPGFLIAAIMWGQPAFQNLAPNGDGSAVYFSSSLRMKGTDQYPSQPKVFVWDANTGVRLYEQAPPTIVPGPPPTWRSDTAYNRIAPSISSDGRTVAITGMTDCNVGTPCGFTVERYEAEIRVNGGDPMVRKGQPSVSPNGRFVALGSSVLQTLPPQVLSLLDLSTGQTQNFMNLIGFPRRHGVADDGTVIIDGQSNLFVQLRQWSGTIVPLNVLFTSAPQINAFGTRVFYQIDLDSSIPTLTPRVRLMTLHVITGEALELTTVGAASGFPMPFGISDDGSLAAFIQSGQAWNVRGDGTGLMQVTHVPDTIVEIALSGSGSHLFAITGNSRMLRVDLRTMAVEEIIPATPIAAGLTGRPFVVSPGALFQVITATPPIPEIQSFSLFGRDLPILSASTSAIELQIPFDMPEGIGWPDAVLKQQSNGPFESAMLWSGPATVFSFAPQWYFVDGHVAALHQDFSGPITIQSPAHQGEIVHAFGSGFGPVAPQPALGQPASANPLSQVTVPFMCGLQGNDPKVIPADLLFGGLAPGWIGLYQFDIRLPARPAGADTYLLCGKAANFTFPNIASGLLPMASN